MLVGLDPGGDVALIKLLGKGKFPAAELGDSDTCASANGCTSSATRSCSPTISNPRSPTASSPACTATSIRPARCSNTPTACRPTPPINPGNSGGPMFDSDGRLIGINGRGSFEKRGRVNVGVGYAISINQIKRFIGLLKSGRIVDHASLGATVSTDAERRVVVDDILDDSDAYRRGLRYGDEIVRFAGREIASANAFKNVLGTYPERLARAAHLSPRRQGIRAGRAAGRRRIAKANWKRCSKAEPEKPGRDEHPPARSRTTNRSERRQAKPGEPGSEPRPHAQNRPSSRRSRANTTKPPGYTNYWFNRYHQQRVWNAYLAHGDFAETGWNWKITRARPQPAATSTIQLTEKNGSIVMPGGQSEAQFGPSLTEPRARRAPAACSPHCTLAATAAARPATVRRSLLPRHDALDTDDKLADCLVATTPASKRRFYFDPTKGD